MASEDRTATQALAFEQALQDAPYKFGFFQAIRRMEALRHDLSGLGRSLRPSEDPVRLIQEPLLDFASSELSAYHPASGDKPARLVCCFFGLLGPNGPLPLHLTEYARERLRNCDDPTLTQFLNVFHHRLLSLFYRAWADAQPTVQFDRPDSDRFAAYVRSLFGLGMPGMQHRDPWPDTAKQHYAGLLGCQTRHASGLRSLLTGYFRIPILIEEFQSHWMDLPDECCTQLTGPLGSGRLGEGAVLGQRVWESQYKFRIVSGPLTYPEYQRFLPGGESLPALVAVVRNYIGDELEWELQLVLKRQDRPPLQLGQSSHLGRTAWLSDAPGERDADDLVFSPMNEQHNWN